jgi:integrative and conjugative element protein (TIGR02256 family)
LLISQRVIKHFEKHQQMSSSSCEAGGQLFAKLSPHEVSIEQATGPRRSDSRSRTLYVPDRFAEQIEIDQWHRKGLHYVSDWHTHPESIPHPSGDDVQSIRDSFSKSQHSLHGFLLVIVGTAKLPTGVYVSLNNPQVELVLHPVL